MKSVDVSRVAGMWPDNGLESVQACPICDSTQRALLLEDLRDELFGAPGEWRLWRCTSCRSAFLDPRPSPETLHLAYADYFTHESARDDRPEEGSDPATSRGLVGMMRRVVLGLFGSVSEAYAERLAPPPGYAQPRLLDVGCGNGAYLRRAKELGWAVSGCDFDPLAVAKAASDGTDVRLGGPEQFADVAEEFDALTLSHVLEHVPDPAAFLAQCRAVMKPGASIFIDTPNIDALGFAKYGCHWRGLEPPRHLSLFNWSSLEDLLTRSGFVAVRRRPEPGLALSVWLASDRLAKRATGAAQQGFSARFLAGLLALLHIPRNRTEFCTFVARKPTS